MRIFRTGLFSFLIVALILFSCKRDSKVEGVYASLVDSTKYVGIQTCRNCHEDKYQTYIHTGMGLSFDRARRSKSSAIFDKDVVVADKFKNLNYHPWWNGDSLMVDEFRLAGRDTIFRRTEQINWIVGSGQHTNSHMMNVNGYIYQVPVTFYTQKKHWDLPPGFEDGFNSRFNRAIGLECMSCHNAFPKFVEGSENKYEFIANGIDCERCHGPGSSHVAEKLKGNVVDVNKEIDYSIVNPAKLPIDLQLDVCQRCHIQGNAVLRENKTFLDFRPAMKLSDVMDVYMPVFSGDNTEHIMASHVERMKLSKCFTASLDSAETYAANHESLKPYKNAMTCVTCHDPHVSVRSTGVNVFNDKCRSCHHDGGDFQPGNPAVSAIQCTESMDVRMKVNDNCVSCHMPRQGTIDIPHVSNTDHWIRVQPRELATEKIREFITLDCINNSKPSNRSRGNAFLSYFEKFSSNPAFLDSAAKYFSDINGENIRENLESLVRLEFLRQNYAKVILYAESVGADKLLQKSSLTNEHAWTCYRIGESYGSTGKSEDALKYFSQSVKLAPFVPDFRNKLAGIKMDLGKYEEAKKDFEFIIAENPNYTSAYVSYGYLLLSVYEKTSEAGQMYDKALALDPDNIQALLNKSGLSMLLGDRRQSVHYLQEVLKRDKNNETARSIMKSINKY